MANTKVPNEFLEDNLVVAGDLTVDTSTLVVDSTNNEIGINNSNPEYVLDVIDTTGNAYISIGRGTQSQGEVGFKLEGGTSGGDWYIYQPTSSNDLRFYQGSDKVTFDSSGNVGIGTSSPSTFGLFTVSGSGITNHINSTSGAGGINFYETGSGRFSLRTLNGSAGLAFYDTYNGTERMRIDSAGRVMINTTTPTNFQGDSSKLGIYDSTRATLSIQAGGYTNPQNAEIFLSGGIGDGGTRTEGWYIRGAGTGAGGNVQTVLDIIQSRADTDIVAARFDESGNVGIGTSSPVAKLHVIDATNGSGEDEGMVIRGNASNTGITNNAALLGLNAAASNSSNYRMIQCNSNTTTSTVDAEFIVYGNGNVNADGTFSGNGADYAEFFESTDGTAIPRGTSIVIENGKVRAATSEDDVANIIGVARPKEDGTNSMVIGNTAWNNWTNKYLTDDFGVFIMEEFTSVYWTDIDEENKETYHDYMIDRVPEGIVVPDDAETKTHDELGNPLMRRTLNPDYDESQTYTPRLERDEWIIVGLMGQVQILKGQPVNDRWIKMRDISDTVEEWYIR